MSCVFMDLSAVAKNFGVRDAVIMQMDLGPVGSTEQDEELAAAVANAVPGALFASGRGIRTQVDEVGKVILGMGGAIAFAALLLGCFGVGNVIAAQVSGRGYEFGVLRATGAMGHFTAAHSMRKRTGERPFSRSYGAILPSSLTRVLPITLVFSTRPPVSVCGTVT